jgi:hypothetical protein
MLFAVGKKAFWFIITLLISLTKTFERQNKRNMDVCSSFVSFLRA